ncbi:MAG TPA: amidohydrolase [Thermoanaerobaculia bacterium]|nr:amidohydrolase [Thermoanaerobaculia bacterium]
MLALLAMTAFLAAAPPEPPADLVLVSARVWTGDPKNPEAEALAVRGGRLVAVGSDKEIGAFKGPTTVVLDGKWRRVVPGFIDCHTHMTSGGFDLLALDLRNSKSPAEFTREVAAYVKGKPAGVWLTDGTWDHTQWTPPELPTKALLDPATGDHPTCISRLDGHMTLCNSLALELAGITAATPDPPGGVIVRDAKGEPTGILKDGAMELVDAVRPARTAAEMTAAADAAMMNAVRYGVTSVQDLPGGVEDLPVWDALRRGGRMIVRVNSRPGIGLWEKVKELQASMAQDDWLRVGGVKGFMDGSLGSGTAAMFEGFTDEPGNRGVFAPGAIPLSKMEERVLAADKAGLQVEVHAIGDRANAEILNIYERVWKVNGPRDRRFRIEHAQHLRASDIPRFAELGVIASMQPYHAVDDGRWADKRLGPERVKTSYAWRSLLDAKATVAFGSDWDVAPISPILGIAAAVTRRTLDGRNPGGWVPSQRITVEEALRAYTVSAAYAGFEEKSKGSLEPGKLADFVVLSADPFRVKPEEIEKIEVDATVVGGRTVYVK